MRKRAIVLLLIALTSPLRAADDPVVVIAYESIPKADLPTLQRLYTGRVVSISRQSAVPVNLPAGHRVRQQFIEMILNQNDEQYTGYWLVRRYVGKGTPPQELADVDELVRYVIATPGAIGYAPLSKVPAGTNIIFRQ